MEEISFEEAVEERDLKRKIFELLLERQELESRCFIYQRSPCLEVYLSWRLSMNKTQIEWAKNPDGSQGYTWNPITGCLNGCSYCYARKLANTRLRTTYLANHNMLPFENIEDEDGSDHWQFHDPFYPRFWEDRLKSLYAELFNKGGKPKGIFVCDMSDLFGIGIPEEWTKAVLDVIKAIPRHRFYLLTKQPQNLIKFSPFPDNCWVGVSATDYQMFVDACGYLGALKHEGKIKTAYISIEPLISWDSTDAGSFIQHWLMMGDIDQVIIGAQTKPTVYPKIEWVREIVEAADKAGIPVFLTG